MVRAYWARPQFDRTSIVPICRRSNEEAGAWRPELVMGDQLQRYDESADNSPWINALAELRQRAAREGHCYQHVQAITVAIDQYAEKALGNRDYFLNKHYGVG